MLGKEHPSELQNSATRINSLDYQTSLEFAQRSLSLKTKSDDCLTNLITTLRDTMKRLVILFSAVIAGLLLWNFFLYHNLNKQRVHTIYREAVIACLQGDSDRLLKTVSNRSKNSDVAFIEISPGKATKETLGKFTPQQILDSFSVERFYSKHGVNIQMGILMQSADIEITQPDGSIRVATAIREGGEWKMDSFPVVPYPD